MWQRHRIRRLMPLEPLWQSHRPLLQPCLEAIPVDTLVKCIPIRCRLLVLVHPVERQDARVEVAHEGLAQEVDTVLVMSLVHVRGASLVGLRLFEVGYVVVLPQIVQAVELVHAQGDAQVAAAHLWWILHGCEVVADA